MKYNTAALDSFTKIVKIKEKLDCEMSSLPNTL